ncbi:MAG: heavy metal translocating P-type ATPase [Acutalibacteraceae bacterium]
MEQYIVTGMHCAACSARVEKAVSAVEGVTDCTVNLLTGSMQVEGTASSQAVIAAVEDAGYGAVPQDAPQKTAEPTKKESSVKVRLLVSVVFLAVLMYVSMGHGMWGWPVPAFLHVPAAQGLFELLLSAAVMVINQRFFISGFRAVLHRAPNMDTLVAMGSGAAFVYSVCVLFAQLLGTVSSPHYYFESAAMILTLITVGKLLEEHAKGKTTDALHSLMQLRPQTAVLYKDGKEITVPVESVKKGDIFCVRPGERVPADGIVLEGNSALDESALTGESLPVDKQAGDSVSAAAVNTEGYLRCEATHVGEDTTLSKIIRMVQDASAGKAPIARIADKVSGVFVPVVLAIAAVTVTAWLFAGKEIGFALARGISVLVISCPCALGLATPVAIMVGNGVGARQGTLFKTAAALEATGRVQIAALDKTGTLTEGKPQVTDILPADGVTQAELMTYALALEQKSEHPLSKAVLQKAEEMQITAEAVTDFEAVPGRGLRGKYHGKELLGGNSAFIGQTDVQGVTEQGKTPLLFSLDGRYLGMLAVADTLRADSAEAVAQLQKMGIRVVMLTGDNARTAKAIAEKAGVQEVFADLLPGGKEQIVRTLQNSGRVAMVGDGINDAPALTAADIGIAVGAGTDVAMDAADVVLMQDGLHQVPEAIRLSRAVLRNIRQNLFWAFLYNCIGIPLAAGVFIPSLGWELDPMFGAAAMSLSSFCVVTNALRLNLFSKKTHKKERKSMEKTIRIEGMMCAHCEAHVKKALEALAQVEEAVVSHEKGTACVKLNSPVSDDVLKAAVEAEGYKVL